MGGFNDEALGVEFYIKVDPARFNTYPVQAQKGHIFNLLTQELFVSFFCRIDIYDINIG